MRGKKYSEEVKEKALAMVAVSNSIAAVSQELGIPRSTLTSWIAEHEEAAAENGTASIAELRRKQKEKFVNDAWSNIRKSLSLIEERLDKALNAPDDPNNEISLRELVSIISTLYDKQALCEREATAIIGGNVTVRFEDL